MSTKIDSTPALTSALPTALDRVGKTYSAAAGSSNNTASASPRASGDTVSITGDAMKLQNLEKSLSGGVSFDLKRVEATRQAISEGRYRIDPQRVATRLMASDAALG